MKTFETFHLNIKNQIAILTLNQPKKRNAMKKSFWTDFPDALRMLDEKSLCRVCVIKSDGPHFCAGIDITFLQEMLLGKSQLASKNSARNRLSLRDFVQAVQKTFSVCEEVRFPVLVAAQGGCFGAALGLLSAADCRYCTTDAFFVVQETNLGLTSDIGSLQRLSHIVGEGIAKEWAFTGKKVLAEEATSSGFINASFPSVEVMYEHVMKIAETIVEKSPLTIYGIKEMLQFSRDHSLADSLDYMATWQAAMLSKTDIEGAFRAQVDSNMNQFEDLPKKKMED